MIETFILSCAIAQVANLIAWSYGPLQDLKDKNNFHYELFDCPNCLSFWISLPFFIFNPSMIFITMIFSQLIEKLFR